MKVLCCIVVCLCSVMILLVLVLLIGCVVQNVCFGVVFVSIYVKVDWNVLFVVFDIDLKVGFVVWCSVCLCLKGDVVWVFFCVVVGYVDVMLVVICVFLQNSLDVYVLCVVGNCVEGLIIGYYELIYFGSLICIVCVMVLVYGVLGDMVSVQLDSVYFEFKGKCLCGCVEGCVFKFYDDVVCIVVYGVNVFILVWFIDLMDLQFLQIQGLGCVQFDDGWYLCLVYVDQNGYFYCLIGCWLVEQGELVKDVVSMDVI